MSDLTDDQILSILGRMDSEQRFFDQMHATYAQVGNIIKRYKEIQANIGTLAKQEQDLINRIGTIQSDGTRQFADIEKRRGEAEAKVRADIDQLRSDLQDSLSTLKKAADKATARRDSALSAADSAEQDSKVRIAAAVNGAEAAEKRLESARAALAERKRLTEPK